jgi:hypothetical protein
MLPLFSNDDKQEEKDYSEYDCTQGQLEIFKKVKKLRYIIGEEIDSTKTGQKPELSREFDKKSNTTDSSENRRSSQEKIAEIASKYLECNKFTPRYMPYFFIYVRDNYKDKYTKYKMRMNEACKWLTHESIDNFTNGIMQGTRTIETESEKKFWEYYESHSPLLLTDCLMNRICWKLERLEKELETKIKAKWGKKDDYTLMSYTTPITVTKAQDKFIKEQYNY